MALALSLWGTGLGGDRRLRPGPGPYTALNFGRFAPTLCSYLSAILLVGLLLNATVGWWWADPLAALGIAYLALREGVEAWRGGEPDHNGEIES